MAEEKDNLAGLSAMERMTQDGQTVHDSLTQGLLPVGAEPYVQNSAANQVNDKVVAQYTSHPIQRYRLGKFRFDNSVLSIKSEKDHDEFKEVLRDLESNNPAEFNRIRRLNVEAATRMVEARLAQQSRATKGFDSSVGDRARDVPKMGTGILGVNSTGNINGAPAGDLVADLPNSAGDPSARIVEGTAAPNPNQAGELPGGTGDATSGENQGFAHGNPKTADSASPSSAEASGLNDAEKASEANKAEGTAESKPLDGNKAGGLNLGKK